MFRFGGVQTRNSTLEKVENGVYLEVLHNVPSKFCSLRLRAGSLVAAVLLEECNGTELPHTPL